MSSEFLGIHTAVPEHRMSQQQALQLAQDIVCRDARDERMVRVLYRKAGVENRYTVVPYDIAYKWTDGESNGSPTAVLVKGPSTAERMQLYAEFAPPLAIRAGSGALKDAAITSDEVTHLVTVSCTGFAAPGVDIEVIQSLGLSPTVQRVNVGYMGCHGAVNGLRVAQALSEQPGAVVLLIAVELCSLHYRFDWDNEAIVGNSLFSDGAAAVVLGNRSESSQPRSRRLKLLATGSCLLPHSQEAMRWDVGDFGFEMRLTSAVPEAIEEHLADWMRSWLESCGTSPDSIDRWLVHPGGPRIVDAAEAALQLEPHETAVSRQVLRDYGNMSSPTLLFVLQQSVREGLDGLAVLVAFGPGLVAEAALVKGERVNG